MPQFETKTIEELTDTLIDYRGKTPEKTLEGVKLITAKVIKEGFIQEGNHEFIAEENYDSWMRRGLPKQWDILITTEAPLGEVAQLRTPEKVALAQRVILMRGKSDLIDQGYYFQTFKSDYVQAELNSRGTGTTVLGIKQSELLKVRIPYYPLSTQQKIAAILSAYDNLIENNTRRIKILEEMAQAIYREWFVDFRFPGHEGVRLVESELGPVPEGWEVRKLGEVCFLTMGQSPNSEFYNENGEGLPFHQGVTNFGSRFPIDKVFCTVTNRVAEPGDILFSVRAPVGRINLADKKIVIGRGLSAIQNKTGNQLFTYHQLKELFKEDDMIGGGTIFKSVTKEDVNNIQVLIPNNILIKSFEEYVEPISSQLDNLIKKDVNLRRTRDLLLPKLISGEIDVSGLDIKIPPDL